MPTRAATQFCPTARTNPAAGHGRKICIVEVEKNAGDLAPIDPTRSTCRHLRTPHRTTPIPEKRSEKRTITENREIEPWTQDQMHA